MKNTQFIISRISAVLILTFAIANLSLSKPSSRNLINSVATIGALEGIFSSKLEKPAPYPPKSYRLPVEEIAPYPPKTYPR